MKNMILALMAVIVTAPVAVAQQAEVNFDGDQDRPAFSAAGQALAPVPALGGPVSQIRFRMWSSDAGTSWTCAVEAAGGSGCQEWKSDKGVSLTCGNRSAAGECQSWQSDKDATRSGTEVQAGGNFPPFFLQRGVSLPSRSVQFEKYSPTWDDNGMGWVACSEKDQQWQSTDNEWRTVKKQKWEIYVCRYVVTYNCRWKNCTRPYPNTEPNSCSCKVSCNNSAERTDDCHWEQLQAE